MVHLIFYIHEWQARGEQRSHALLYINPSVCFIHAQLAFALARHRPRLAMEGVPQMQNDAYPPTPQEPPRQRRPQQRLPPAARKILTDFCENVTPQPSMVQRLELVKAIHEIPGCDWYTKDSISRFFYNHHKTLNKVKNEPLVNVQQTLFPSFRLQDFHALEGLIQEDPNPTQEMMIVWAGSLSINPGELGRWVIWYKDRTNRKINTISQPATAPLPSQTSLERPFLEAGPSSISSRVLPPIITSALPLGRSTSHLPTPQSTVSPEPPPRPMPAVVRQIPDSIRRARALADVLKDTPATDASSERVPRTVEEFNTMFAPHESRMQTFMKRVSQGEFEQIGLKSSYAKKIP
ncbi:hypothetical protein QCA50_000582 [Cerrena zonata]|uniref:Uncharacterized protein n=1 Tax=Cerrena zonata TaxID=2478898 RepID=A0AAW0GY68_9APHY